MKSSKLIIQNITQKVMAIISYERRFHHLKYFEVGVFSSILLESIINLHKVVGNNQFNVIVSCLKQF